MATSGILMPAWLACRWTVPSNQDSVGLEGSVMTRAPVMRLAIHLDIAREMNEPPKPITSDRISRAS